MPTYVYRCPNCGRSREEKHPMSETREGDACDFKMDCYGRLKKVYTPTSAIFEGDGWGHERR